MSKDEDYIEIKDIDSIKKALENAEMEYEENNDEEKSGEGAVAISLLEGPEIKFLFNKDGQLTYIVNE